MWIIRKPSGGVFMSSLLNPFDIFGEVGCKIKMITLLIPILLFVCCRCWGSGCTLAGAPTFQGAAPSSIWWPASGWTSLQPARTTSSTSYRLRECNFFFFTGWLIWLKWDRTEFRLKYNLNSFFSLTLSFFLCFWTLPPKQKKDLENVPV